MSAQEATASPSDHDGCCNATPDPPPPLERGGDRRTNDFMAVAPQSPVLS